MKTKAYLLFLLFLIHSQVSKAQKAVNHLNGALDYTHETLEFGQRQANGEEIILGKIDKNGSIEFNLPEFNIKALYDSIPLQHYNFHNLFYMNSDCKDRDVFAKTPFDDVYTEKYKLLIKKYGMNAIYETVSADIKFEKGWNFIEESVEIVKNKNAGDSLPTQVRKVHFSKISPSNKKVKWSLRQIQEDEKIQTAKRLDALTPISKKQFEKWAPNKLGDLSMTSKEHGGLPRGQQNKNNIHLTYADKTQTNKIELYVIDCARSPGDMEMIDFAYAMENDGKDAKNIKPYITQYNEREKITQLFYKAEDRILVNASGVNMNGEELWGYIQKLKVEKLVSKK